MSTTEDKKAAEAAKLEAKKEQEAAELAAAAAQAEKDAAAAAKTKPAWERAETYEYVGPGIVPGVPNRDLDKRTVERLPIDLLREVALSPYYKPAEGGK